jgi:hypothetical protein
MMNVTITNPDGGEFVLYFTNPLTGAVWASSKLNTFSSQDDFYYAVKDYYKNVWNAAISYWRTMYDANDTITTDKKLAAKVVYTVQVAKSLPMTSVKLITAQKVSTKSSITFTLPSAYQLSSAPLSGSFAIKCVMPDGSYN